MRYGIRPRGAFTLIELIVVLTLISLLATLTISAIFRFREGQRERQADPAEADDGDARFHGAQSIYARSGTGAQTPARSEG